MCFYKNIIHKKSFLNTEFGLSRQKRSKKASVVRTIFFKQYTPMKAQGEACFLPLARNKSANQLYCSFLHNPLLTKSLALIITIGLIRARVAELVDALDLGSSALRAWGFDSPLSHHNLCIHCDEFRSKYRLNVMAGDLCLWICTVAPHQN